MKIEGRTFLVSGGYVQFLSPWFKIHTDNWIGPLDLVEHVSKTSAGQEDMPPSWT